MRPGTKVKRWIPEDISVLRSNFLTSTDAEMAIVLDRSPEAVQTKRNELGIIKPISFSVERSAKTQFKKGHVSVIIPHELKKKRVDGWTDEEIAFLKTNWETMTSLEVAAALGRGRTAVSSKASDMGIKKSEAANKALRQRLIGKIQRKDGWTPEQLEYLKNHWATMSAAEIAEVIGRTAASVKTRANDLGLKTDKETLIRLAKKTNAGQFTPEVAIGQISARTNKSGAVNMWIKTGPKQWQQLHRYNWFQAGLAIPDKQNLCFKDGDTTNCCIENLELRTSPRQGMSSRITVSKRKVLKVNSPIAQKTNRVTLKSKEAVDKKERRQILKEAKALAILIAKQIKKYQKAIKLQEKLKAAADAKALREAAKADKKRPAERIKNEAAVKPPVIVKVKGPTKSELRIAKRHEARLARDAVKEVLRAQKAEATKAVKAAEREKNNALRQEQLRRSRAQKERKRIDEKESKKPLQTKPVDLSQKIPLRIDHRTVVYVNPGADIDAIRAKYGVKPKEQFTNAFGHSPQEYQF
jgi:hypothetical protein